MRLKILKKKGYGLSAINMKEFNKLLEDYTEGKTLPQEFYKNENIFSEEMKRIYFNQWLLVDHISRIQNPGEYFLFNDGIRMG